MIQSFSTGDLHVDFDVQSPELIKKVTIDLSMHFPGNVIDLTALVLQSKKATEYVTNLIDNYCSYIEDQERNTSEIQFTLK